MQLRTGIERMEWSQPFGESGSLARAGLQRIVSSLVTYTLMIFLLLANAQAQKAFVRINQVGYKVDAPKRAYLMSADAETGAAFHVRNARGDIIFSSLI